MGADLKEYHVLYVRSKQKSLRFSVYAENPQAAERIVEEYINKKNIRSFYSGFKVYKPRKGATCDFILNQNH